MIARHHLNPLPNLRAKLVLLLRMKKSFAIQLSVTSFNIQPNRGDQRSIGPCDHLKLGEVLLEFQGGKSRNLPKRNQSLEIVQGSSAHLVTGWIHFDSRLFAGEAEVKFLMAKFDPSAKLCPH